MSKKRPRPLSFAERVARIFGLPQAARPATRSRRLHLETLEARVVPTAFTVATTADTGLGSLRAAITAVNADTTPDIITFAIGTGDTGYNATTHAFTIHLLTALPTITNTVNLDATTEWVTAGFSGVPDVELEGSGISGTVNGLTLGAGSGGSTVRGFVIDRFTGNGIEVDANGNTVAGNYIGTDVTGLIAQGNIYRGVYVTASNNTIGGTAAAARNVISGNIGDGVDIVNENTTGNLVEGNYIGVDVGGNTKLANGGAGVIINTTGVTSNTIGGLTNTAGTGAGNVISGNAVYQVRLFSNGQVVQGNILGLGADGTTVIDATGAGVTADAGANNSLFGGTDVRARNVIGGLAVGVNISGNSGTQILNNYIGTDVTGTLNRGGISYLYDDTNLTIGAAGAGNVWVGSGSYLLSGYGSNWTLKGNRFGTTADGSAPLLTPNGISISSANNITVGGTGAGEGNQFGDYLDLRTGSGGTIQGNTFGLNAAGTSVLTGSLAGLGLYRQANVTIGGSTPAARNVFASGGSYAIQLYGFGADGNAIRGNYFGTNAAGTAAAGSFLSSIHVGGSAAGNTIDGNVIARSAASGTASGIFIDGGSAGTIDDSPDFTAAWFKGNGSLANNAGYENGGTAVGTTGYGAGLAGSQALSFSRATPGYVYSEHLASYTLSAAAVSVQAWINPTTLPAIGQEYLIAGNDDPASPNYALSLFGDPSGNQRLEFRYRTTAGTQLAISSALTPTVGAFRHVAATADGTNVRFYVDGLLTDTVAIVGTPLANQVYTPGNPSVRLYIGGGVGAVNRTFDGRLEDVVVVNRALTAAEIARIVSLGGDTLGGNWTRNTTVTGNTIGLLADGTTAGAVAGYGIRIDNSESNTIGGTTAAARNVIGAVGGSGVNLTNQYARFNTVSGNYIGTDGTVAKANLTGVTIQAGANANTIGGTTAGARNVISGNGNGVIITDSGTTGNVVAGNYIGTNAAGTAAVANSSYGIALSGGAANNTIGGTTAGARNVISGNVSGVGIYGAGTTGNVIAGNYIGTDATGQSKVGNTSHGVYINASGNTVGGTTSASRNVISGNGQFGVWVDVAGVGTPIQNNYLGTNAAGIAGLGNRIGVILTGDHTTVRDNVISSNNGSPGADEDVAVSSNYNMIAGNIIGLNAAGTALLPPSDVGIVVTGTNNIIGGTTVADRNVISGHILDGIELAATVDTGNVVEGNYIGTDVTGTVAFGNGRHGVFLAVGASNNTIGGTTAGTRNVISGNGGDGVGIIGTSSIGNVILGNFIGVNAAGTSSLGNAGDGVYSDAAVTIGGLTATAGTGAGNVISGNGNNALRDNGNVRVASGATIQGNIIGLDAAGDAIVDPLTQYDIYSVSGSNILVGGSVAGAGNVISGANDWGVLFVGGSSNTVAGNYIGTDITGLRNRGNEVIGISLSSTNSTVGGVTAAARNVISGNGVVGIDLRGASNTVSGNYVGVDRTGNAALGNGSTGIEILSAGSTIGGTTAGAGNVISGNGTGVGISGASTTGNVVAGNYIGTNAVGTAALSNSADGVQIFGGSTNNTIGGTAVGAGNLIAHNGSAGVHLDGATTTNNAIRGNTIFANAGPGIALTNGAVSYAPSPRLNMTVTAGANSTLVQGSLLGAASTTFGLDFFSNDTGTDGQHYLGSVAATTDATGLALFSMVLPGASKTTQAFTTTLTVPTFNTSAFSAPFSTALSRVAPTLALSGPTGGIVGLPTPPFTTVITDPNAQPIITYAWSATGPDGKPVALPADVVTTEPSFHFTPTTPGTYTVTLTAGDGSSFLTRSATYTARAVGATVVLGGVSGGVIQPNTTVALTSTVTPRYGTTITSYAWSVTLNGVPVVPTTATNGTGFTFTPTAGGVYAFTLTVADSGGGSTSGSAFVAVAAPISANGTAPTAPSLSITGAPNAATAGQTIVLTGNPVAPGSNETFVLHWQLVRPDGSSLQGTGTTFAFPTTVAGPYSVLLTANGQATTILTSLVIPVAQGATLTIAPPASLAAGSPGRFTAVVNNPPAGVTYTYAWTAIGLAGSNTTGQTFDGTASVPGRYSLSLQVKGSDGSTLNAQIAGAAAPVLPVLSIGGLPATVTPGSSLYLYSQLAGNLAAAGPLQYRWTVNGTASSSGPTLGLTAIPVGSYTVKLTATALDGQGTSVSASFGVDPVPPVVTIRNAPGTGISGNTLTVSLTADAVAPGVSNLTYNWMVIDRNLSDAPPTVVSSAGPAFTFSGSPAGDYLVSVFVSSGSTQVATANTAIQTAAVAGSTLHLAPQGPGGQAVLALALAAGVTIDARAIVDPNSTVVLAALGGFDTLIAGNGNVVLQGDSGNNLLIGGTGRDTLIGHINDTLIGGNAVSNLFQLSPAMGEVVDATAGGTNNTLSFAGATTGVTVDLNQTGVYQADGATSTLKLTGAIQNLVGGAGDDLLFASNNSVLRGGGGNDQLVALGRTNVTLFGDTGNATLSATGGSSIQMVGGAGNATLSINGVTNALLIAGTGNATLTATAATSITMFGGTGNDSVSTSGGNSILMVGGAGNATLSANGGTAILMQATGSGSTLTAMTPTSITMFGGTGNDSLSSSGGSSIAMVGGAGNSTLTSTGGTGISMQATGTGSTLTAMTPTSITMFGGTGNDSLSSSGGSLIAMVGGAGNSTMAATGGTAIQMIAGAGNATLTAIAPTSITMFGGTGNDSLSSSGGMSIQMVGGAGNSTMTSSGDTAILMIAGTGNAMLTATAASSITMFGGTGNDSLSTSGGSSIAMVGGAGNSTLTSTGGTGIQMIAGTGNAILTAVTPTSITMFGGTGNDSLSSSGGSSIAMVGGAGNSTLTATGGTSILMIAGTGNATLTAMTPTSITMFGGTGNDSLSSSGGSSIAMVGGAGNSTLTATGGTSILMIAGTGNATLTATTPTSITMFGATGNDSLSTSGGSSIAMVGGAGNTTMTSSGGTAIQMIAGTGNATLTATAASSITMFGGTGNDSMSSSGGSSITMVGGAGNSTLTATGGTNILMLGGTGNATLTATTPTSITMFGGTGNDSMATSGGSSIAMVGGAGNSTMTTTGGTVIQMTGGTGNATMTATAATSITMFGGTGNDSLSSSGGSSIAMVGGAGNSTLTATGGTSILMLGGTGNATLMATMATSITMFGGTGNDSLSSSGGSSVVMIGGAGNDTLASTGDTNAVLLGGGAGNVNLSSTGGTSITMFGGSGNDTLSANGGTNIGMYGLEGDNTYTIAGNPTSVTINDLATFGKNLSSTDGTTQGINTIQFAGFSTGVNLDLGLASQGTAPPVQQIATNVFLSLTGTFQRVVGTGYADIIKAGAGGTLLDGNGGNDTLVGGTGPTTLLAGTGNETFTAGTGGTTVRFAANATGSDTFDATAGTGALDFSAFATGATVNLDTTAAQAVGGNLTLTLKSPNNVTALTGSTHGDAIVGNASGDTFQVGAGNNTFTGGGGRDAYYFGGRLGANTLNESSSGNILNFYGLGSGISLDLRKATLQAVGSGSVTLTNPLAFGTVVGTPFADTIRGNDAPNVTIIGAGGTDNLFAGSGNDFIQGYVDQVVYLDFTSSTGPGSHVYTPLEIATVQQGLAQTYSAFNYFFTQSLATAVQVAAITGGQFATVLFDANVVGGAADQLDPSNLHLNGTARVNVSAFLGDSPGLVPATSANVIGLTTTIAAHELGHLAGLQHQDAIGPIGSGLYSGIDPSHYYPNYTGPTSAVETPNDILASPNSVGSTLLNAAGPTYIGERDAVKLAFNDTGTVLSQNGLTLANAAPSYTGTPAVNYVHSYYTTAAGPLVLPALAVTNTLPAGVPDAGLAFHVNAVAIAGTLATPSQQDFYAFQGQAGQLMNFQVISGNDTGNAHPIVPELLLVGPDGRPIADNVHSFESADSTILDFVLPTTGTYYVGVDSLLSLTAGDYKLFLYSFATGPKSGTPATGGGDALTAGSGNDTLVGSSGNDSFTLGTGTAVIRGGSGQYTIGNPNAGYTLFDATPHATTLSLASNAPTSPLAVPVTFRADITAVGGGTPTGTVNFFDLTTGTSLGNSVLAFAGGVDEASLTVPTLGSLGTHQIVATYSSDAADLASTSNTLTVVSQATPSVSATDAGGTYNGSAFAASATVNGVASLEGVSPTLAYYQGTGTATATPPVHAGTYTVVASFAGSTDYTSATSAATTFTIRQAPTTVSVLGGTFTYDATAHGAAGASVTGAGGLTATPSLVYYDASNNVLGGAPVGAGTYSVIATYTGDTDHTAGSASATITINRRAVTVTANGLNKTYGATDPALTYQVTTGSLVGSDTLTGSPTRTAGENVGTYAIGKGSLAASSNYTLTYVGANLTITAKALTVTANAKSKVYGTSDPTFTYAITTGTLIGSDTLTGSLTRAAGENVGTYAITQGTLAASSNYTLTYVGANLTITQPTSISTTTSLVSSAANNTSFFGASVTFTATVSAALQGVGTPTGVVTFLDGSTTLGTGTLSGGVTTFQNSLLTVGVHSIKAVYAANGNFLTSTSSTLSQTVLTSYYVLNTTASGALSLSGNASTSIAGLVEVDSSSSSALSLGGNASVNAARIQVVGGVQKSGNATINHTPITGSAVYLADPLAGLAAPTGGTSQGAVALSGNSSQTINPGVYSQISVSGNARLTLNAGVYVIAGGGFTVTGNASVTGTGVTIYNAGSNYGGGSGGTFTGVTLSGNGSINLSAPTTGPYAGILLFQSRDNSRVLSLSGNAMVLHGGVIYASAALLTVSGNASLSGSVVVNQLQLSGNAASTLTNGGSAETSSNTAGALVSGVLGLFVDNTGGVFTAEQLARVDDAIAAINAVITPYGASIVEVSDAQSASTVLTEAQTSACGSAADGVLGCESATGITIVSGWNWYDGADPGAVGGDQYDFETIVLHELGHSLGLGHSADAASAMYGSLSTGEAKRMLAVADLKVSDTDSGASALHAAATPATPAPTGAVLAAPRPIAGAASTVLPNGENVAIFGLLHLPRTSNGTASLLTPPSWEQKPALVTTAIADAFSPFAVTAADGWNREGTRNQDTSPFNVTSLDTVADRVEDRPDDLWSDVALGEAERDQARASIVAEWSSSDGFAARLSSLEEAVATPSTVISAVPEGFAARLSALGMTFQDEEVPTEGKALSAGDWFFCRRGDRWGNLLNDEEMDAIVETNSPMPPSSSD